MKIGDVVKRPNSLKETVYTVVGIKNRGRGHQIEVQMGKHPCPTIRTQIFPKSHLFLYQSCSEQDCQEITALFATRT